MYLVVYDYTSRQQRAVDRRQQHSRLRRLVSKLAHLQPFCAHLFFPAQATGSLNGVIDTVSAKHDLLLGLLRFDGKYVIVGAPPQPYELGAFSLIMKRALVGGSLIGGLKETQEMLDFCAKNGIVCDIEKVPVDYVNTAYDRVVANDVRYRFVLDIENTLK